MSMAMLAAEPMIIDADTHVVEPPDLWTSRVSARYRGRVPVARWDESAQEEVWFIGGERLLSVGTPAMAGWKEYPPGHPKVFDEIDPIMRDAPSRLRRMDELGIQAQVLYPNVGMFFNAQIMSAHD